MRGFIITCIFVLAISVGAGQALAQTFSSNDTSSVLQRNETVHEDYFATGDTVTVSGTVNGDAYVAGREVLVDGTINGDLIVAGGNVTIRGTVSQDVRAAGGNITISSQIGGSTTVVGGNVSITDSAALSGSLVTGVGTLQVFAPVGGGMTIGAGTAQIGNSVGGNISAGIGEISFSPDASVSGNLTYWSEKKANIAQGASVSGTVTQHTAPQGSTEAAQKAAEGFFSAVSLAFTLASFLSALILGLLLTKFAPRFLEKTADTILEAPAKSALIGFVALITIPVAAFILFVTLLLIPLSFVVMGMYFIAIYFSKIFVAYAIGKKASELLNSTWARGVVFLAGLVLFYLLSALPLIGWIVSFAALLFGLGALLSNKGAYYKTLQDKKLI